MELSRRSFSHQTTASHWEELWEAGPYFDRASKLLEGARKFVILAGWQIDSRLPMRQPQGMETLKAKVLRLCESNPDLHFYILMWDHAFFYVLERERWQGRVWDDIHPRVHFLFDNRHPLGGSHHEKLCIIDGTVGLCGGIDFCDDRWDTPQHLYRDPRRSLSWKKEEHGPYHDMAVQVGGPVCAWLQDHVARRWRRISTIPFPEPVWDQLAQVHGGHPVLVSRTIAKIDAGNHGLPLVREVEFLLQDLIRSARNRIIMEGQYYWSRRINDLLIAKIHEMKGQDFEIFVALADLRRVSSPTRRMADFQLSLLARLEQAAADAGIRFTAGHPYVIGSPQEGPPRPIYIHSKLLIVDDRYICVGSANFATRALRMDTEINLTFAAATEAERAHVRRVARHTLGHWNIGIRGKPGNAGVHFRQVCARLELEHRRRRYWIAPLRETWIRWVHLFDPEVPWLYRLKRGFRNLQHRRPWGALLGAALIWSCGVAIAFTGAGGWEHAAEPRGWGLAYAALLFSVWIVPVPFLALAIVAAAHLGPELGPGLVVWSFWTAATWGYVLYRSFPSVAQLALRGARHDRLDLAFGRREFPGVLRAWSDPRFGVRSKIAYQGLYSIPSPWFILLSWAVVPGFLYLVARGAATW